MRFLSGDELKEALEYIQKAADTALSSSCLRAKCGSVIVKDNTVIGSGFNSPPGDVESQRRCSNNKEMYHKKVTDKTCCVHAEQRAMFDALRNDPDKLKGSRIYFTRVDGEGKILYSGKPYCTICSKMALDLGIAEFVLYHKEGICVYETEEYNNLSFEFK